MQVMVRALTGALLLAMLFALVTLIAKDAYAHPAGGGFSGGALAGASLNNIVLTSMFGAVLGILCVAVFRNNSETMPFGSKGPVRTSKARIALVIGIAVVGLFTTFFALVSIDWFPSRIDPQLAMEQKRLLEMTREMPEIKSFLQRSPDMKEEVVNIGYSYSATYGPISIDSAQIKYSYGQYYRDHSQGKFYSDNGFHQEAIIYVHLTKTPDSTSINTASGTLPMHHFQDYYYAIEPQCIISKLGKEAIPGFPSETSMVYLATDCPPIQQPFTSG